MQSRLDGIPTKHLAAKETEEAAVDVLQSEPLAPRTSPEGGPSVSVDLAADREGEAEERTRLLAVIILQGSFTRIVHVAVSGQKPGWSERKTWET